MLPRGTEKIWGDNLPEALRAAPGTEQTLNKQSLINTSLSAVNAPWKQKSSPPPHPLQLVRGKVGEPPEWAPSKQPTAQHLVAALMAPHTRLNDDSA